MPALLGDHQVLGLRAFVRGVTRTGRPFSRPLRRQLLDVVPSVTVAPALRVSVSTVKKPVLVVRRRLAATLLGSASQVPHDRFAFAAGRGAAPIRQVSPSTLLGA